MLGKPLFNHTIINLNHAFLNTSMASFEFLNFALCFLVFKNLGSLIANFKEQMNV